MVMMAVQASQDHHVGRHHGSHKVSPKQASPRYCHDQCDFSYIEVKKKKKKLGGGWGGPGKGILPPVLVHKETGFKQHHELWLVR